MVFALRLPLKALSLTTSSHTDTLRKNLKSRERDSVYTFRCVFQVPACYLTNGLIMAQVEHIDNPKGYGEGNDPREVDPGLRPVGTVVVLAVLKPLTLGIRCSPY